MELDDFGELLFGRPLRLRTLLWVSRHVPDDNEFGQAQVATGLGYRTDYVGDELDRMCELGLIKRLRPRTRRAPKRFRKAPTPLWAALESLFLAMEEA